MKRRGRWRYCWILSKKEKRKEGVHTEGTEVGQSSQRKERINAEDAESAECAERKEGVGWEFW
jgi:hypothetical protein